MLSPRPRLRLRDESGVSYVLFAVFLPIVLLMGVVTIDVGNWWVHKRHLQTQVDAAAFAGGPEFVGCYHDPASANLAIASRALAYAGDTLRPGKATATAAPGTTNYQVQTPNDVRAVLNANAYWKSGDPTDGSTLDNTLGAPCLTRFLDVKATDDEAPLLWGLIPYVASPKTHARIEIRDIDAQNGMLPWAVPEIDPRAVVAFFVDEDTGSVFDYQMLMASDNPALPWSEWSTAGGQEQVFLSDNRERTGIVILVSKQDPTPRTTGTLAEICGQDPGLVACYGGSSGTSGISFIHSYNGGYNGTLTSPQPRQVELFATGCSAADLSAPYFTLDGGCSANIQAVIDFGVTGDPTGRPTCALVDGMSWSSGGPDPSRGFWSGTVGLATDSGRNEVNLQMHTGPRPNGNCGNAGQHPNHPVVNKVAVPYVASAIAGEESGPVEYLKLTATHQDGTPVPDANSVERNDPNNQHYNYTVTVGLPKPLSQGNYADPPLVLRLGSPSGSQNQAWNCDDNPIQQFREEIANGCLTTYRENYTDLDGDGDKEWRNFFCTGYTNTTLPPTTVSPNPPADCIRTEPGDKIGEQRDGLHDRFETPCVPNRWPDTPAEAAAFFGPDGYAFGSDPRYVTLVVTDNTAFQASGGNDKFPLKYFAGFYVTGWDYHPTQTPGCPDPDGAGPLKGNDPHPIYGTGYNHSLDNGDVWGYFVEVVVFSGAGTPSDDLCTFGGDPGSCIAVLVE